MGFFSRENLRSRSHAELLRIYMYVINVQEKINDTNSDDNAKYEGLKNYT